MLDEIYLSFSLCFVVLCFCIAPLVVHRDAMPLKYSESNFVLAFALDHQALSRTLILLFA